MLEHLIATMFTPSGLIVMIVGGVITQIIVGLINLGYGKSKIALLRFATERSEKQKAIRLARVERMRVDSKFFQYCMVRINFYFHMAIIFLIMTISIKLNAILGNERESLILLNITNVIVGVNFILTVICIFKALALQQDIRRSLSAKTPS
jgi:hypothetical protein